MSMKFTTLAPQQGDTIRILEAKILAALNAGAGGGGGGTGGAGIVGAGSPQNVVTAPAGTTYWDSAALPSGSLWIKQSGAGNTGWVQVTA